MPEGNPLVAESKQDPDGPGAFTAGNGDYGWAGGIGIAESSMDAFNGIKDGDWVSGGLGMLSLAGEIAGAAIDPFGYLMSSVASFLMEHIQPLKDMLDSVAGNPPVIQSYADTWGNVSKALGERKTDFDNAVKNGTTGWTGAGADAYRTFAAEHSDALSGAATVAGAISTVTMIMGQVVSFVRETVRQLIADLVGKLIAWVMEEVFSLGFGTPVVVAQASAAIAKWGKKIGELLKKLTDTIRKVSPLLSKLVDIFEKIAKVFGKVLGKVSGLDGLKVKEGGFVHKIPQGEGGVHTRAHGGGDSPDGGSGGDGSHSGDGDGASGHADGDSTSSDPMNTDSSPDAGSRRSRDGSSSPDGDGAPSHAGDGSPEGSPSAARSSDDSPSRSGDSSPSHAGDSSPSPTRSPSHAGDSSPSPTRGSEPSHAGDSSPSPTRGGDGTPPHGGDNTPSRGADSSPSPTRGSDSTPSHASDNTPSRASDSSPSPTRGSDGTPSHAADNGPSPIRGSTPSHAADNGPSPTHTGSSPGSHAGTDTPSSAAPPRTDGTTSASGTAPTTPRTSDPGTVPPPRGGDGAPPQSAAPMAGGGMPPGGTPGGGGLGGGTPRTGGGGGGWTGTPGSPGAHIDAPGRPRTGADLPTSRPRTPDAPAPAARGGYGSGGHTPGTNGGTRPHGAETGGHAPGTNGANPGTRPHSTDGHTPSTDGTTHAPHDHTPTDPDATPHHHDPEPPTPDQINARHAEHTPAGSSYHADDPTIGDLPHRVPPDPHGRYTVDVHVTPDGHARIGDHHYTPEEFADILRRNPDYDGRPIRLIGCDASSNDFAHRLSRELDTDVTAPTKPAWTDSHGRVFSSDYEIGPDGRMRPRIPPDGEWNTHHPDGTTHRAGDDGFAPDSHHGDAHDVDADSAFARGKDHPDMHDLGEGWREPEFTRHEDVTLGRHERFFDPANPRHLEPNTRYEVTDPDGRFTRVYTNGETPPRITHIDADVPNTRVGNNGVEVGNPDASHLHGDVDYRVSTGEGQFEFHTDADGRPELDIDHFDPPLTPPPVERRITGYDPAHNGDGPFGATPPEDLKPNSRYEVYSKAPDGTDQWHGTFYTSGDNPPEFTHIKTWHDNERGMINPETGDQHTMHDQHAGRPDGMPVRGAKYEIGAENMHYHVDEHGNAAVSWEPDYTSPATKRVGLGPQERTGHVGLEDHPGSTVNRGGHTADHRSGGLQGRMGMVPQLYEQNHSVGNPDNWRQMEIDRQTFERGGGNHGTTRVYADAPSTGETPDRLHVMSERIHPDGTRTYNYRSFPNVPNPAPVVPPTRT
ncbi:hypothetical protein MUY14_43725 [Amycolatopsis sp. FBCC-B4732]|uniref:hypothetical protein n=1 Tax=Amycolatopsis sp. FBCC-B4732 TaxID=3079339 RepID=UPI001FF38BDB|nr:hypothetical protein [Amycolatopsis sp. FBCC-B4732]UOX88513.1 hypothetical protein MUY14_43725 [Amycolatopsis sp. FBCC-B4732]